VPHLDITDLAAMLALALLCWGLRVTFVLLVPADRLPAAVARGLRHLAPAALASICAVELTGALQRADLTSSAASLAIVGVAAVVALRTRNLTWTVLSGVAAVLLVDLVLLAGQ
jgi:branched-subunit amino acid transport protein